MQSFSSIDGIASGLNTTEIIDALMQAERRPAVLMEQQQAEKTSIITTLKAFQAKLLALSTQSRKLSRAPAFEQTGVTVSDDSILTASASGRVAAGTYDISVLSLARNHQIASQGFSDDSQAMFGTGTITISVGDGSIREIAIDAGSNSLQGIKQAINDADAGVTASIINDGSGSNAYRLVLSADNTGVKNKIKVTSSLSGGTNLNFTTAMFDQPELAGLDPASNVSISLGASASYSGNVNKTFSFTVRGAGTQTIGSDNVTIDWTDGANSGTIIVTQSDTEVELVGAGADGLKLTFSAGELTGGDTFEVSTFAPTLQQAADAKVSLGSTSGGGSPITVTSETNEFKQLISGLSLTVMKETAPGETVRIATDIDVDGIKKSIQTMLDSYNDVMEYVDKQNSYNVDTGEAGTLLGDYSVQLMQNQLRSGISNRISGISSQYNQLATIGIRTNLDGKLVIKDPARLETAIRENLDDVINLFTDSGTTSSNAVSFISSGADTRIGQEFEVNITQVATRGSLRGSGTADPSTSGLTLTDANNRLKFSVDGIMSDEIVLSARTYTSSAELIRELQSRIDADEKIGSRGVTAEWISTGDGTGYIQLTSSTYGSGSRISAVTTIADAAYGALGLQSAMSTAGKDVAGTINGEEAEGKGQLLTGKDGNKTTAGLQLRIDLTADQLTDGPEATVTIAKGVAARMTNVIESLTAAGEGMLDRRIKGVENQIANLKERIKEFDERLALRRESLQKKFYAMEQALGQLTSLSNYLATRTAGLNANWKFNQS